MAFGIKKKDKKTALDSAAPDGPGQVTLPNPGEFPPNGDERGMPRNSLGAVPPRGNRAGGGTEVDTGARVGYMRNLEFSAGGRSQLVATGPASPQRPHISAETGQVQVSTAQEGPPAAGVVGQTPAVAGADGHGGDPPAQPESTISAGEHLDTVGSSGPERRVDRRGP
jgi:hypothetical protein